MVRTIIALSVVVLVAMSGGCRMCASPYDNCGPTFTGECGQDCDPNARSCSILAGQCGSAFGPELILPESGEVIWETDEVVMDSGEVFSPPEELALSAPSDVQPLVRARQVRMSQGKARSWRAVQR